jgi:hypothetical protein
VDEPHEAAESKSPWWAILLGLIFLGGLALAGVVALVGIYPSSVPTKANPGWIDLIFASKPIIFAARLLLFSVAVVLAFASAFTVLSIISWTKRRQWLSKAGPFEVSREAVEQLEALSQFWQEQAQIQANEVEQLQEQLRQSNEMIEILLQDEDPAGGGFPFPPAVDNVEGRDDADPAPEG